MIHTEDSEMYEPRSTGDHPDVSRYPRHSALDKALYYEMVEGKLKLRAIEITTTRGDVTTKIRYEFD